MSLETEIKNLTAAVIALTAKLESANVSPAAPVAQAPAPVVAPVVEQPAPVVAPVAAPVAAPAMPAAPSFQPQAAAPAPTGAPFSDPKGLIDYVMSAYKALGPQKGAQIQSVLTGLGYANINDVKPEHYGNLFAGVEALK